MEKFLVQSLTLFLASHRKENVASDEFVDHLNLYIKNRLLYLHKYIPLNYHVAQSITQ